MNRSRHMGLMLVLLLTFMCPMLQAQTAGTVSGRVLGPGSVPVPGARVLLINPQTRMRRETWSDLSGNYTFTGVAPGQYRLLVMIVGFRPAFEGPIHVTAGKAAQIAVTLALAMPGQTTPFGGLQPGAGSAILRAGSASGAVGQRGGAGTAAMTGVAGATGGATAGTGLRFSAGAATAGTGEESGGGSDSSGGGNIGGAAGASNSFVLTGNVVNATAPAMQRGRFRRFGGGGPAGSPFGGGPRFGGGGFFFFGGFGGPRVNKLHGNLFDFYSNSALDARPFPLNVPSQPQIPSYSERIGVSLGGPLSIPKIYKNGDGKTSFFLHYNITTSTNPYNLIDSVPTAAERTGDFASTVIPSGVGAGAEPVIYNPFSNLSGPRTAFAGNQIPQNMLNQAALGLLTYIPQPNLPGEVQNYHQQGTTPATNNFVMARVGQRFSAKDNLSIFYFLNFSHSEAVSGFPDITSTTSTRNQNVNVMEFHTFSPQTMNIFTANFNRSRNNLSDPFAYTQNIAGGLGILGVSTDPVDYGIPAIGLTNFTGLTDPIPSLTRNQTIRVGDSMTINRGKHFFHVGGDFSRIELNSDTNPNARGTFSFTGYSTSNLTAQGTPVAGTGFDLADFLLGLPQTTSERFGVSSNYLRGSAYDVYANDDWRTTSHLTLNLGGRWEYDTPFTEKYGHLSDLAFGPSFTNVSVVTGQNPGTLPPSLLRGHADNISPRLGIAYRPWISHSLVVRAGYGIFYNESVYSSIVGNMLNQSPFATTSTLVTSPAQLLTLESGFPAITPGVARNTYAVDPAFLTPYAQSWDMIVEQNLGHDFIFDTSYIGTRGTHLPLLLAPNITTITTTTTGSNGQLISNALPFEYDTSGAASIYQGLRVSLRHFARGGLGFFADYVYSKSMDNAASVTGATGTVAQNPFDIQNEWALSNFNPTQTFHAFMRYELPFGARKRFLNQRGALSRIFGNWSVMNIVNYSSGTPFTALLGGNYSNNIKGAAPFSSLRAQATGLPVTLPSGSQSTLNYFNTLAFALPPAGEYGDAGRDTIPGPPSLNFNMSVDRLVTISREKGLNADFRLSANNVFNTVNFNGLSTTLTSSTFGRILSVESMRSLTLVIRLDF